MRPALTLAEVVGCERVLTQILEERVLVYAIPSLSARPSAYPSAAPPSTPNRVHKIQLDANFAEHR